mmetsp:Transcript_67878/g.202942  ORF Transcript_67878/g.202942 Transcript_67878/m.202942 type:complete len:240 (-) Transcript_67878:694-1413(-)
MDVQSRHLGASGRHQGRPQLHRLRLARAEVLPRLLRFVAQLHHARVPRCLSQGPFLPMGVDCSAAMRAGHVQCCRGSVAQCGLHRLRSGDVVQRVWACGVCVVRAGEICEHARYDGVSGLRHGWLVPRRRGEQRDGVQGVLGGVLQRARWCVEQHLVHGVRPWHGEPHPWELGCGGVQIVLAGIVCGTQRHRCLHAVRGGKASGYRGCDGLQGVYWWLLLHAWSHNSAALSWWNLLQRY